MIQNELAIILRNQQLIMAALTAISYRLSPMGFTHDLDIAIRNAFEDTQDTINAILAPGKQDEP